MAQNTTFSDIYRKQNFLLSDEGNYLRFLLELWTQLILLLDLHIYECNWNVFLPQDLSKFYLQVNEYNSCRHTELFLFSVFSIWLFITIYNFLNLNYKKKYLTLLMQLGKYLFITIHNIFLYTKQYFVLHMCYTQ